MNFSIEDLQQLKFMDKSTEGVLAELNRFRMGAPFMHLEAPCTTGHGIRQIPEAQFDSLVSAFHHASVQGRVTKFIPASGAASRMFQALLQCREAGLDDESLDRSEKEFQFLRAFIKGLPRFAFRHALDECLSRKGTSLDAAMREKNYSLILDTVLFAGGLDYANQPKALIYFHDYPSGPRTSLQEHLAEALLIADQAPVCRIHLTISPEHRDLIEAHVDETQRLLQGRLAIDISVQPLSSQTIAVSDDNVPFRDEAGRLVFRPAGHGALLENLSNIKGDIVFIKNIDNIAPARFRDVNVLWKKLLGGFLVTLQEEIHGVLRNLEHNPVEALPSATRLWSETLGFTLPESTTFDEMVGFLKRQLNRPVRVCGMVKNEGEPGGGPFWVRDKHGNLSCQIVESSQIDHDSPTQTAILKQSTHFNPVDLVCGVCGYRGKPFDLKQFADPETCFISKKSKNGRSLKALELPGLWNGAMSDWITVFVEVPLVTFNPVKTINDLLRPEHQTTPPPHAAE